MTTTASVASQPSEQLRRLPASGDDASIFRVSAILADSRMNETQQMHPTEHTSPPPNSIHNNNNNNSSSKNRASNNSSSNNSSGGVSNDAKMEHHLALLAREHRENSQHSHLLQQHHQQLRDQLREREQRLSLIHI